MLDSRQCIAFAPSTFMHPAPLGAGMQNTSQITIVGAKAKANLNLKMTKPLNICHVNMCGGLACRKHRCAGPRFHDGGLEEAARER